MSEPGDTSPSLEALIHFNAHDEDSKLPCLCCACIADAGDRASVGGVDFIRAHAAAQGRVIHYWLPAELDDEREAVAARVVRKLRSHLEHPTRAGARNLRFTQWRLKQTW